MTETLGEALPKEMARGRDQLLPLYDAIPAGIVAATMMRADLDRAAKAMAAGDLPEMIRAYAALQEYKL